MNRKMIARELLKAARMIVAGEDLRKEAETCTDPDRLRELSEEIDWTVRARVAFNPNTPEDVLRELAEDKVSDVAAKVGINPNTPEDLLIKMARKYPDGVAKNPNTPPDILRMLSEGNPLTRRYVAENPSTPVDVLRKLIDDENWEVNNTAQRSKNLPRNMRREVRENSRFFRYGEPNYDKWCEVYNKGIIKEINCCKDPDELRKIANSNNKPSILAAVASNENTPEDVLEKLASSRDRNIRCCVADNESVSEEILRMLSNDGSLPVRIRVAENPNTPEDVLEKLSRNANREILNALSHNPNYIE